MSYSIIDINEQINDINEQEQNNDNEQYFLFNGQGITPQGDEIDMNLNININNSFSNFNNNGFFEHSNNNNDNFMDNEYSAAPIPLRRREADIALNNNSILLNNNLDNDKHIDMELKFSASNNNFQYDFKNISENIDNEEKSLNQPFSHNDFSCFNPNFLDNDKDMPNNFIIEDDNNISIINNENNNNDRNNINLKTERITPFPGMNDSINLKTERVTPFPGMNDSISLKIQLNSENSQNINVVDAPTNIILANSSSSQNTNAASILNSGNFAEISQNSLFSSNNQIFSNVKENCINSTFNPDKNKNENLSSTKITKDKKTKKDKKIEKKAKKQKIRRYKPDSLRKKIKARLHKKIRDIINKKLKICGSKMLFDYLPQPFITNVNVVDNKAYLKLNMRTLFKMVFGNKPKDKEKVITNLKVLNYLDSNDKIRIQSGAEEFLNSTYEDIIRNYINGKFFEEDANKLYEEGETKEYIDKYIFLGKHWIEFYNNNGKILNV